MVAADEEINDDERDGKEGEGGRQVGDHQAHAHALGPGRSVLPRFFKALCVKQPRPELPHTKSSPANADQATRAHCVTSRLTSCGFRLVQLTIGGAWTVDPRCDEAAV